MALTTIHLERGNPAQLRLAQRLGPIEALPQPPAPLSLHLDATGFTAARSAPPGALTVILGEQFGDSLRELGAATGLEAVARRGDRSRFALAAVQAGSEAGAEAELVSLLQGAVPTLANWRRSQAQLLDALAEYTLWWLRLAAARGDWPQVGAPQRLRWRAAARRSQRQQRSSEARWLAAGLARRLRRRGSGRWRVSCARLGGDPLCGGRLLALQHLEDDGRDWYADPFLVGDGQRRWLFSERWSAASGRGEIALAELGDQGLRHCGTVLAEPFHLSFPRVFAHAGRWFATVESAAAAEVRLYEAEAFPQRWQLRRVLLRGEAWLDPVLVERPEGWYLLVSSSSTAAVPRELGPELQLFHSPSLLSAPFVPHPRSPLLIDASGGRNGGLLEQDDGTLLRVAQQVGFGGGYGTGVELRRITALSPEAWQEEALAAPWLEELRQRLGASHLHSVSRWGDQVAVDWIGAD